MTGGAMLLGRSAHMLQSAFGVWGLVDAEPETTVLGLGTAALTIFAPPTPPLNTAPWQVAPWGSVLLFQASMSGVLSLPRGRYYFVDAGVDDERYAAVSYLVDLGATPTSLLGLAAAIEGALAASRRGATWQWVYSPGTEEGEEASSVVLVHLDTFRENDLDLQTRLQQTVAHFLPGEAADRAAVALEYER